MEPPPSIGLKESAQETCWQDPLLPQSSDSDLTGDDVAVAHQRWRHLLGGAGLQEGRWHQLV